MSVTLHVDLSKLGALERLAKLDKKVLLKAAAAEIEDQTVERITVDKKAPDGTAWQALSPAYGAWKDKHFAGIGMMEQSGSLREAIQTEVRSNTAEIGLDMGDNMKYAAIQQYGGQAGKKGSATIPARPYLGMSDANRDALEQVIDGWLKRAMG